MISPPVTCHRVTLPHPLRPAAARRLRTPFSCVSSHTMTGVPFSSRRRDPQVRKSPLPGQPGCFPDPWNTPAPARTAGTPAATARHDLDASQRQTPSIQPMATPPVTCHRATLPHPLHPPAARRLRTPFSCVGNRTMAGVPFSSRKRDPLVRETPFPRTPGAFHGPVEHARAGPRGGHPVVRDQPALRRPPQAHSGTQIQPGAE